MEEGEIRDETVLIMIQESVLAKEEKAEMKKEIGLTDIFVEDKLMENLTEGFRKKDAGNVEDPKEKPYPCKIPACDKKFGNKCTLKAHIRKLHFKKFESIEDLESQIKAIDSQEKPYPCKVPGCVQRFGVRGNLKTHIRLVHLKEKPFLCEEPNCYKEFSLRSGLKVHVKTVHQKEKNLSV